MSDSSMPADVPPPISAGAPGGTSWTPDGAVSFGWRMVKKDPLIVGVLFLGVFCSSFVSGLGAVVEELTRRSDAHTIGVVVHWALVLVSLPIQAWIAMGMWRFVLKTARGEKAGVGDLFAGGPFIAMFGALLLNLVCVLAGTAACIVPGVILALGWAFFTPLLLEKNLGSVEALQASWRLTMGHKGQLFLLWLFFVALAIVGLIACCVGVVVSMAIIQLANAFVYLRLTGQTPIDPPK
jgi:uncharacterized membrane protein